MNFKTKCARSLAKTAKWGMNLLGRKGSYLTGVIALAIDKNFIANVDKPQNIIAISGTNGKTTTSNMLSDVLDNLGKTYISNRLGSNTINGIASMLASMPRELPEYAVVEQDELWMRHYNKELKPHSLTVTNLFQDSFDRNDNIYYVFRRINQAIDPSMKLILNASDSISAYLGHDENPKAYFTILPLTGGGEISEKQCLDSKVCDRIYCPRCETKLTWKFKRYHHIGEYLCENCGFTNPEAQYVVTDIDITNQLLHILDHGNTYSLPLVHSSIENSYNQIACYATLREYGFSPEQLIPAFKDIRVVASRFNTCQMGNKLVQTIVAKGINPVATSRILFNISQVPGPKTMIYLTDYAQEDLPNSNQSWMYNTDMKYAQNLDLAILHGKSAYQLKATALMDGVDREKLVIIKDLQELKNYIDPEKKESIFILKDIEESSNILANKTKDIIKEIVGA